MPFGVYSPAEKIELCLNIHRFRYISGLTRTTSKLSLLNCNTTEQAWEKYTFSNNDKNE